MVATLESGTRRGFIAGALALITAPAIVRVENIMPVRVFDPYYTRAIMDYNVATDMLFLRVDRAHHPLPMWPPYLPVPMHEVYRYIPRNKIEGMRPAPGFQECITAYVERQITLLAELKGGKHAV